jgi:tetratricopeptide (TPR) repeat protein
VRAGNNLHGACRPVDIVQKILAMKNANNSLSTFDRPAARLLMIAALFGCFVASHGAAQENGQAQIQTQGEIDPAPATLPETPLEQLPVGTTQTTTDSVVLPALSLEEQLDDAQSRFLSYFADGLYRQALVAAKQTLQLALQIYGPETLEAALAHANVATAQTRTGELQGALTNYKASIELIEDHEGIVSPRLVNPLMGLAATHNEMGAFDLGLTTYKRALRINHVELGLNNSEQMIIRDGLTESYIGLDDMEDANFQQEAQLRIIRQEHGDDLDILLPAIYKLAGWYQRSNQPEQETLLLQNATRTVKKMAGSDSNEQIEMLRSLAGAFQRMDMPAEAIRLLKKAWKINEDSEPPDPVLGAAILVEIGDFYNGFNDLRDARRYYTSAWEALLSEGGDSSAELLNQYFGAPVNIWSVTLPDVYPLNSKTATLALEEPDLFREGLLVAEYDIDQNGRADNIRIIESDPAGMLDKRISYLLGRNFYRPRYADGVPVVTEGQQLRHRFIYLPDDAEKAAKEKSSDSGGRLEYPAAVN